MDLDMSLLQPKERASFALRALYEGAGCRKYHMGQFEEYALYQANQNFLPSRQVITFTDLDGRLLALKPDVTLSIAKSARPAPGQTCRFYYSENVYRPAAASSTFKEIPQMGLEFIGAVGMEETARALRLAARSLAVLAEAMGLADAPGRPAWQLKVGHMGRLAAMMDAAGVGPDERAAVLTALRRRSAHEIGPGALAGLLAGGSEGAAAQSGPDAADLEAVRQVQQEFAGAVELDLSLAGEMEYYNGLIFQGFLRGVPRAVLRGGRYDLLARKFSPGAGAVGFAVYLDELDALARPAPPDASDAMLSVALPKGRLGDKVYGLLAEAGCLTPEDYNATRKLVVEDRAAGVRCFLVKPCDVPVYVAHGAADVGIVGKDILAETDADLYELLDTGLGRCWMCVAGLPGRRDDLGRPLRVATKFPRIAKAHFAAAGRDIEIIRLNGSIELAPILGLADVIVDIVESGATLRENGLVEDERFLPISARLIANKASYQFKRGAVDGMMAKLRGALARRQEEEKK